MTVFFIELQQASRLRVWQVFHVLQKIYPASPRHSAECPLASLPRFARAGRHRARLFQGRQRFGFQIKFGPQAFVLSGMEPKIRQLIPACLFVARLWNPSRNRRPSQLEHYRRHRGTVPRTADGGKPWLSAGVIDGAQRKESAMIKYLAVVGTLAAFVSAPPWRNSLQLRDR